MNIDNALLTEVITIAKKAGREILTIYNDQTPLKITMKADLSPVTLADLVSHDIISSHLSKLTPDIPILSEEDANFDYDERKNWQSFWLVDPLDGTKEYISRNGQFTVNIALIKNHRPILGVIYLPLKDIIYAGANTITSFKEEGGKMTALKTRNWQLGDEIILVTTRKELHTSFQQKLASYGPIKITYRASSIKFCVIAQGEADIYLRNTPIQEWDTAAGQCIVENAGGIVLDSNWKSLRYNTKPHLLNPPFVVLGDSKQLLAILKTMPMFKEI